MRKLTLILFGLLGLVQDANALDRILFNHPGLVVDLGVGLWAWPVPVDADGDGDLDLIVSCPDKPFNGIWLFENTTGDTAKNPFPVFKAPRKLSHTVHYVTPSYVDGGLRVLSPGWEYFDFVHSGLSQKRPIVPAVHPHKLKNPKVDRGPKIRHNQWKYVDYEGDGRLDLICAVEDWSDYGWDDGYDSLGKWIRGPLHGFVYLFRNRGTTEKPDYETAVPLAVGNGPLDTFGCPSPNFADFDGDGDLDLLCGEFLDGFTYFENSGTRSKPVYSKGRRLKDSKGRALVMDLEMIVPVAMDWNKDGFPDLIVGDEDGRVALILHSGKCGPDRCPIFHSPRYFQQEAREIKCGALATPVGVDWDGDGDTDILCGNTAGYVDFFENLSGKGVEKPKFAAPVHVQSRGKDIRIMAGPNGSIQGPAEAKWGYTTLGVADWNGDGLLDLVLNSIWGKVVWFPNLGTPTKPSLGAMLPIKVQWEGPAPELGWGWLKPEKGELLTQWRTTPFVTDFNRDGLADLVMLDTEGYLAFYERTNRSGERALLPPRRIFCDEKGKPLRLALGTAGKSGRRKLCLVDWDGDGNTDILLNGENANFLRQVGKKGDKILFKDMGKIADKNVASHDVSPTVVDWNNDSIPDLLAGAEDGHLYYLKNPRSAR